MNHKSWPLIADALSDVCLDLDCWHHRSVTEFPYKDIRQRLHGAASWFWGGTACGLLGTAIWFPSLQGGLGDGRACCLITTSKSFLAPLVHVKKTCSATSPVSLIYQSLKLTSHQLLLSPPSVDLSVCVFSFLRQTTTFFFFSCMWLSGL